MKSSQTGRALDLTVQGILIKIVESAPTEREFLRFQASHAQVAGGPITMLTLKVAEGARLNLSDGPLPVRTEVCDQAGDSIGEIIVWVSDGYLSALEFAWWTDMPPTELPEATRVRIR